MPSWPKHPTISYYWFYHEYAHDQLMINSWSTPSYHHHSNEPLPYHISELSRWQLTLHVYHLCTSHIHCLFGTVKPHLYANIVLVRFLVCSLLGQDPFSLAQFPPLPRNPCMALCVHFHSMYGMDGYNPSLKYFSSVSMSDSDQFPFQTGVRCFFMYTKSPLSV